MKKLISLQLALFLKNPLLSGRYVFASGPGAAPSGHSGAPPPPPPGPTAAPSAAPSASPTPPPVVEAWEIIDIVRRGTREDIVALLTQSEWMVDIAKEPDAKKKVAAIIEKATKLSNEDLVNARVLSGSLKKVAKSLITKAAKPEDKKKIQEEAIKIMTATNQREQKKEADRILFNWRSAGNLDAFEFAAIKKCKEEDYRIKDRMDKLQIEAAKIINPIIEAMNLEGEKQYLIHQAERGLGVQLKAGTKIVYFDPEENDPTKQRKILEIASVEVKEEKGPEGYPFLTPIIINLTNSRSFSIGGLERLIEGGQGYQEFDSQHVTEEFLEWDMFGIKIEPGAEFEYEISSPLNPQKKIQARVRIENVDPAAKTLELDQEIVLSKSPLVKKKNLTFGEFARFASKMNLQKAVSTLDELQEMLKIYTQKYNQKHGLSDPVIEIQKGEELETNGGEIYTIDAIEPNHIILKLGRDKLPLTFAQFLNWIRENEATKYVPLDKAKGDGASNGKDDKDAHGKDAHKPGDHENGNHGDHEDFNLGHWYHAFMHETVWLSPMDIQGMIKVFVEYFKREHGTKSGMRFSRVGKHIPNKKWAREYQREFYSREGEAVHKQVESMKHQGVYDILKVLYNAKEEYMLKAGFEELASRGQIRWDDKNMHKAMNRFISGHLKQIPSTLPKGKSYEFDYIKPAIDHWWGENTFNNWHRQNHDTFSGNKKKFWTRFDQLEGDPGATGGLRGHAANLLRKHKMGEWIDPQEYEALIDFTIPKGKLEMESRIYYLIEGVTAKGGLNGGTILHLDRLGVIAGDYLPVQHYLEFLTNKGERRDPETGKIITERDPRTGEEKEKEVGWTVEMFQKIVKEWDASPDIINRKDDDLKKYQPNDRVRGFFSKYAMTHDATHTRASKGIKEGQKIDHDDWNWYVCALDEETTSRLMEYHGGAAEKLSSQGHMNAYAGFAQYLKSVGVMEKEELTKYGWEINQVERLKKSLKSFVRFDTISTDIFKQGERGYIRLAHDMYNSPVVCDGKRGTPGEYQTQVHNVLRRVCEEYGRQYQSEPIDKDGNKGGLIKAYVDLGIQPDKVYNFIFGGKTGEDVDKAIHVFGSQLEYWTGKDKGELLKEVFKACITDKTLTGQKGYTLESDL